jgi:hypothetical protein
MSYCQHGMSRREAQQQRQQKRQQPIPQQRDASDWMHGRQLKDDVSTHEQRQQQPSSQRPRGVAAQTAVTRPHVAAHRSPRADINAILNSAFLSSRSAESFDASSVKAKLHDRMKAKQATIAATSDTVKPLSIAELRARFDEEALEELFAEMCFFARLGCVQPPRCLVCTYEEAVEKNSNATSTNSFNKNDQTAVCCRWVAWRTNASAPLHPDTIADNVVALPCRVVRKLIRNEQVVPGWVWNEDVKRFHETTKK